MKCEIEKTNKMLNKFKKDTGIWPPGRSMPAAMCGGEDKEQNTLQSV